MSTRFVIIGGGPAGNTAATYAARLGAEVTMIERDVVGGAAHLWDCIPSKTMIATGRGDELHPARSAGMGLEPTSTDVDVEALTSRIESHQGTRCSDNTTQLLDEPGRAADQAAPRGSPARTTVEVDGAEGVETIEFDAALDRRPARARASPTGASPTATAS